MGKRREVLVNKVCCIIAVFIAVLAFLFFYLLYGVVTKPTDKDKPTANVTATIEDQQIKQKSVYNVISEEDKKEIIEVNPPNLKTSNLLKERFPIRLSKLRERYDRRRFDTTLYEGYAAFDSGSFTYLTASASINYNKDNQAPDTRSATLLVDYLYNGEKRHAQGNIRFKKAYLTACAFYSFLDSSGSLFLSCLQEYDPNKNTSKMFLLGFYLEEKEYGADKQLVLTPYYYDEFVENLNLRIEGMDDVVDKKGNYVKALYFHSPFHIVEARGTKFYLVFNGRVQVLSLQGEKLKKKSEIKLRYNNEDHNGERAIRFAENKTYANSRYPFIPLLEFVDSRYLVFQGGEIGGGVIDTLKDSLIMVDDSCFQKFDKQKYPLSYYGAIHPFATGAYSTVRLQKFNPATQTALYEQSYCSGGGCVQEGIISMRFAPDAITCKITPKFVDITDH